MHALHFSIGAYLHFTGIIIILPTLHMHGSKRAIITHQSTKLLRCIQADHTQVLFTTLASSRLGIWSKWRWELSKLGTRQNVITINCEGVPEGWNSTAAGGSAVCLWVVCIDCDYVRVLRTTWVYNLVVLRACRPCNWLYAWPAEKSHNKSIMWLTICLLSRRLCCLPWILCLWVLGGGTRQWPTWTSLCVLRIGTPHHLLQMCESIWGDACSHVC
jgi:hypothetical protein